jgi:hypothetical protein
VCTFPLEYCEFGPRFSECKEWLKDEMSDLYDLYYSEGDSRLAFGQSKSDEDRSEALQAKIGTLSLKAQ